jgi:hypothetical protein
MEDDRVTPGLPTPLLVGLAVAAMAAIGVLAYRLDRAYGRWLTRMDPLTGPRDRYDHLRDGYRVRRAGAADFASFVNDLMSEIARARSTQRPD